MKKNWLDFISEEDFIDFITFMLPDNHYIDEEILVDGHLYERRTEEYGKYFQVTIFEDGAVQYNSTKAGMYDLMFGQFGFLNLVFKKDNCPKVSDNVEHISSLYEHTLPGNLYINWINFIAHKTKGIVNNHGQSYYEDLTSRVENIVKGQKLILQRKAERDLQGFEFPLMKALERVGSTATYTQQNRLQESHKELVDFTAEQRQALQEESETDFFS